MKILIDLTYVSEFNSAGVVIYAYRLVRGFIELGEQDRMALLVTPGNEHIVQKECPGVCTIQLPKRYLYILSRVPHLTGFLYQNTIDSIIQRYNFDAFLTLYLNEASLTTSVVPQYAVLHDAQKYLLKKNQKIKGMLYRMAMDHLIRRMKRIITISEYAKESILNIVKSLSAERILVIYNSIEIADVEDWPEIDKYKPYILNINTILPYKNLVTLIKAFYLLKDRISHNLLVKGSITPYWNDVIFPLCKKLGIDDRVILFDQPVSSGKLAYLYKNADLFVSPSLMEGFGYTPIEAAVFRVPVITTKETALFETTRGILNYYVYPKDFSMLADKIESILIIPPSKEKLGQIASKFIAQYDIKRQAADFFSLLNGTRYERT